MAKLFCVTSFLCLAFSVALAQDPTKVEPNHYKLDFENEQVQVVSVHYGPHEKSGIHDHPGGVVVTLVGGHLKFTDQNGKTREVYAKAGEVRWFAPLKHKVENLSDTPYNAVYIGIKCKRTAAAVLHDGALLTSEETSKLLADSLPASASRSPRKQNGTDRSCSF